MGNSQNKMQKPAFFQFLQKKFTPNDSSQKSNIPRYYCYDYDNILWGVRDYIREKREAKKKWPGLGL